MASHGMGTAMIEFLLLGMFENEIQMQHRGLMGVRLFAHKTVFEETCGCQQRRGILPFFSPLVGFSEMFFFLRKFVPQMASIPLLNEESQKKWWGFDLDHKPSQPPPLTVCIFIAFHPSNLAPK